MSTVPTTPQTVPSWLPAMRVGGRPSRVGVVVAVVKRRRRDDERPGLTPEKREAIERMLGG